MPNPTKDKFLRELSHRYGSAKRLPGSYSLIEIAGGAARIYIRYSKVHGRGETFYGLRKQDLQAMEGHPALVCFLWDTQQVPLFLDYSDFEEVFHSIEPASDGQFKAQVFIRDQGTEISVANAGRFNVESCYGWERIDRMIDRSRQDMLPELSHNQVQTLLGSIGAKKGYKIWVPPSDRGNLDWTITAGFPCDGVIPREFEPISSVISEVDVIWCARGVGTLRAMFEVEHSTPVYSALLRFNDVHLTCPNSSVTYNVVSRDERKSLFVRQLSRPTFTTSGLSSQCAFLEYADVFSWHRRLVTKAGGSDEKTSETPSLGGNQDLARLS
ncbi:MAG: hypothetical protein AB1696_20895 [Planctomycetota bacterium]